MTKAYFSGYIQIGKYECVVQEGNLQANRHIRRNAENIIIYNQISGMDDIAAANSDFVFLPEFQQRVRCVACAGFDLNGVHFVFCLAGYLPVCRDFCDGILDLSKKGRVVIR